MKLRGPIIGSILLIALIVNTVFWWTLFLIPAFIKLIPAKVIQQRCSQLLGTFALTWFNINNWLTDTFLDIRWDIKLPPGLSNQKSYLMIANHQSWVDIVAMVKATSGKVPFFRFFLKDQLKYVPLLGFCWWALDYPFMKRYSKEQIAKNPALKGKDITTTQKRCAKFRGRPTTIVNFLEGTRFTKAGHTKQQSPYKNLLKPRAGGIAFVLQAMGDQLDAVLDITIVYPRGVKELWDYLCGRQNHIIVEVKEIAIPAEFIGRDYQNDPEFSEPFYRWLDELWAAKDQRLTELKNAAS